MTSRLRLLLAGALTLGVTVPWAASEWIDSKGNFHPHTPLELDQPHPAPHEVFVCPMRCEGVRAYANGGQCPVCNMRLRSPQDAHRDHSPKHGGVLFMAPDGWHHLEGALPSRHEFRLYVYNDFTKPIAATPFVHGSWVEIVAVDEHRTTVGEPVKLAFTAAAEGEYLRVLVPGGMSVPLEIEVRLQFEGREAPDLFNFNFDEVSH